MYLQVNQVIVILCVWVFCLFEDKWFDKLLRYQIEGQAEKAKLSPSKAIDYYNKTKNGYVWTILAVALTAMLLSFHSDDVTVRLSIISISLLICASYIFLKLRPYNTSSSMLKKRQRGD